MFEKGKTVYIKSVTNTKRSIGLDGDNGIMKSMVGKTFIIDDSYGGGNVRIKSPKSSFVFSWDKRDIEIPEIPPIKPKIFEFNKKHLDV